MNQEPAHLLMLHNFKPQLFQCSYCNTLYFKDETVQSGGHYFSYCSDNSIKLSSFHSMLLYLKDLFTIKTLEAKHFQQQINVHNNAMAFISCMFN